MIAGHFATALVPYEVTRKAHPVPFWFFLLAAQFLDVLMVTFVTLGIETMEPEDALSVPFSKYDTCQPTLGEQLHRLAFRTLSWR